MCEHCDAEERPLDAGHLADFAESLAVLADHLAQVAGDDTVSWVKKLERANELMGNLVGMTMPAALGIQQVYRAEVARIARFN